MPFTLYVNDMPLYMRYGNAPRQYVEMFERTLARLVERETGAMLLDATAHAHVFGRPLGTWAYEEVIQIAQRTRDVWIGTRAEAAKHVREYLTKQR
jgi:hypothetical protein